MSDQSRNEPCPPNAKKKSTPAASGLSVRAPVTVEMTKETLSEIRTRAEKASEGSWEWFDAGGRKKVDLTPDEDGYAHLPECSTLDGPELVFNGEPENRANDARFLTNIKADVLALLSALDARDKEIAALKKELGEIGASIQWANDDASRNKP